MMPALPSLMLCAVVGIADGDTMTVRCEAQVEVEPQTLRVRLAQVDAPERRQAHGERSRQNLAALCFQEQAQV